MTTLAVDKPRAFQLGEMNDIPMIGDDIIYEGAAVGVVDATGLARWNRVVNLLAPTASLYNSLMQGVIYTKSISK